MGQFFLTFKVRAHITEQIRSMELIKYHLVTYWIRLDASIPWIAFMDSIVFMMVLMDIKASILEREKEERREGGREGRKEKKNEEKREKEEEKKKQRNLKCQLDTKN